MPSWPCPRLAVWPLDRRSGDTVSRKSSHTPHTTLHRTPGVCSMGDPHKGTLRIPVLPSEYSSTSQEFGKSGIKIAAKKIPPPEKEQRLACVMFWCFSPQTRITDTTPRAFISRWHRDEDVSMGILHGTLTLTKADTNKQTRHVTDV